MGRIAAIYELELKTLMSAATLAQLGAQVAGRALATSFLKLIPGAGSAVNASVAFALTAATGEAWMRLCEAVHTGKIKPSEVGEEWKAYSPTLVSVVQKLLAQPSGRS